MSASHVKSQASANLSCDNDYRRVLLVIVVYLFINFNSSRMRMNSPAKTVAAATLQGADQCVSTYKSDTTTAQCQPFCNAKHKKFHW